jgi:hypothetical protein
MQRNIACKLTVTNMETVRNLEFMSDQVSAVPK